MKVYNQEKTQILENYDLEKGYLVNDTITLPEVQAVEEQGHYETIAEYENGGKDVKWVVEVEGVEYKPERQEEIIVYIPYTKQELAEKELNDLRERREIECFPYINRGELWYDSLTQEQRIELSVWYHAWLDVTETRIIPTKPSWLD